MNFEFLLNFSHIDAFLFENTFSQKDPHYNHSSTSVNQNKRSIGKRSSGNYNLTSIDNTSNRKDGSKSPKSSYATGKLKNVPKENQITNIDESIKKSKRVNEKYEKTKVAANDESKNRKLKEFKKILKRKDDNLPFEDGDEEAEAIDQQVISENRKNMKK